MPESDLDARGNMGPIAIARLSLQLDSVACDCHHDPPIKQITLSDHPSQSGGFRLQQSRWLMAVGHHADQTGKRRTGARHRLGRNGGQSGSRRGEQQGLFKRPGHRFHHDNRSLGRSRNVRARRRQTARNLEQDPMREHRYRGHTGVKHQQGDRLPIEQVLHRRSPSPAKALIRSSTETGAGLLSAIEAVAATTVRSLKSNGR